MDYVDVRFANVSRLNEEFILIKQIEQPAKNYYYYLFFLIAAS